MIDGSYGRIEYHSWTSPAHNFTDLFALFGHIAMSGTLLARGLLLTILAMVETATGGAETVSVQSVNARQVANANSFILAVEFMADGSMTPHWQYACQTISQLNLTGKRFAIFGATGNEHDDAKTVISLCNGLKKCGAHVVGEQQHVSSPSWNTDNWISSISPNL